MIEDGAPPPLGTPETTAGSSIPGIRKRDAFRFDITFDLDALDRDDYVFGNAFGGITATGIYHTAITNFQLRSDPANPPGGFDPIDLVWNLTFDASCPGCAGNPTIFTTDANDPSGVNVNEHLTIYLSVITAQLPYSPISNLRMNFYNSTFYDPVATRQLWLDTSTPSNPTLTFGDLFLHGAETLSEFKSKRPLQALSLVDAFLLNGTTIGHFTTGGTISMQPVPGPLPLLAPIAGFHYCRRLRRRIQRHPSCTLNRMSCPWQKAWLAPLG